MLSLVDSIYLWYITFYNFCFSNVIVHISNYEPNFMEKLFWENGFPSFGGKCYAASLKLVFWLPFCDYISDFQFFCCMLFFVDYFISGVQFSVKLVRKSTFLSKGPKEPP